MKKVLITGVNSYVENSFANFVDIYHSDEIEYVKISLKDDSWRNIDFSQFDSILHVSGIAHVSRNPKLEELYRAVNTELTFEIAKMAKDSGVSQFVFISSIIVYGRVDNGIITNDTIPNAIDYYGDSKLQAEKILFNIEDESFRVAVIRPPMIYGPESRGNFQKLLKLIKIAPVFPEYENCRSMIYIDNFSCRLVEIIKGKETGLVDVKYFFNKSTKDIFSTFWKAKGKKYFTTGLLNPIFNKFKSSGIVSKVFGDLYYFRETTGINEYHTSFEKSIEIIFDSQKRRG